MTGPPTNLTPGSYSPDIAGRISLDGSRIVYVAQKGNWDLSYTYDNVFTMDPDGSNKNEMQIWAYFGGSENNVAISPNGSTVALVQSGRGTASDNGLFMATVDPFKPTQLNQNATDGQPTWCSNGTKLAFISPRNGDNQVYLIKPEAESGTNVAVQVTSWFDGTANQPYGTPDGKLLVCKKTSDTVQEIYRINLDGTGETQLTNFGTWVAYPTQITSGGRIFFLKAAKDGRNHVFSIAADGTGLHQVTGGTYSEDSPSAATGKLLVTVRDAKNGAGNDDIDIYSLSSDTASGTVSGTLTTSAGAPAAASTVNAYDGDTLAGTTTTDASGKYSLTLPPGGYTLEFVTANPASFTVTRSVSVPPAGTVTQDAFTTPTSAARPAGLIATIKGTGVALRWAKGNDPTDGFTLSGYNVYRASSEDGPWTKITSTPIAPVAPLQYTDTTPGNLANVFYKMTAQTANGTTVRESAFTDVAQAANNLAYNGSFEIANGAQPDGWTYGAWGGDGSGGLSTAYATDGTHSAYLLTGATSRGAEMFHNDLVRQVPVQPGVAFVEGMFGKFKDTFSTWPLALQTAEISNGYTYWYPGAGGLGGAWDTNGLTNSGGDTDWVWLYNTGPIYPFEFSTTTRLSVFWAGDGLTTLGSSTAFADDLTYQMKRFGSTGMVFGRILDENGKGMAGITVKVGDKSLITTGAALFIMYDAPTGDQTLTISVPHKADYTVQIPNYGGYRMATPYVVTNPGPFTIDGNVYYPDGTACPGADVRLVKTDSGDGEIANWTTTTDASGHYTFGSAMDDVTSDYVSHIVAHKNGFISQRLDANFGSAGWSVNNNITLEQPTLTIEFPKTSVAPTIDGTINTSEWAAAQVNKFRFSGVNPIPTVNTVAYTMWDNDNVYFAFVCDEPNPAGIFSDPGVAMWGTPPYWNGHDMCEIRIDPTNGAAAGYGHEWWQIMNNTGTPVFTYNVEWRRVGPSQWGGDRTIAGMVVANKIDTVAKKWYQEVQIPFNGLSTSAGMYVTTPAAGDEWALNLARQRHQPDPVGESMAASPFLTDVGSIGKFVNANSALAKGDLNGDRVVNTLDAVSSLRIAAGLDWVGGRIAQADVNSDAKADLSDTLKIIRKINGKDSF